MVVFPEVDPPVLRVPVENDETLPFPPIGVQFLDEILQERSSSSRKRINPRGVKRKMSNYNLRPRQRQPTKRIDFAKRIRIVK